MILSLYSLPTYQAVFQDSVGDRVAMNQRKLLVHSECAETTDQHQFPWWRAKLDKIVCTDTISIRLASKPNFDTHFLEVRIGIDDIYTMQQDRTFDKNHACTYNNRLSTETNMIYTCQNQTATKFVSVQMVPTCSLTNSCSTRNNVLQLCEVIVSGVPLDVHTTRIWSSDVMNFMIKTNLKNVRQSSVAFLGIAENAISSKHKDRNHTACEQTSQTIQGNTFDSQYFARFDDVYIFDKIVLELQYPDFPIARREITAYVGFNSNTRLPLYTEECASWTDSLHRKAGSVLYLKCKKLMKGVKVVINYKTTSRDEPTRFPVDLKQCDLDYWGFKIVNFAFHKPTKQSHEACKDKFCSDQLVDGLYLTPSTCLIPTQTEAYPWWRVDLLQYHIVKAVTVFGDKTDIEIRVGKSDIAEKPFGTPFEENVLCKRILSEDKYSHSGNIPTFIDCDNPTFGRFVSIQRMTTCHNLSCNVSNPELNICEVQVYGFPLIITDYGTLDEVKRIDAITISNGKIQHALRQEFNEKVAVEGVELYFHENATKSNVELTIIVYVESTVCFNSSIKLTRQYFLVPCKSILGHDIYVAYELTSGITSDNEDPLWGAYGRIFKFKMDDSKMKNTAQLFNPTQQQNIDNWVIDDSIAMEKYSKAKIAKYSLQTPKLSCSYTFPGDPYPWWRMEFIKICQVVSFTLQVDKNNDYDKLHDIEVRVGFQDISDAPVGVPFNENDLCYATGSDHLLDTSKKISCQRSAIGVFFSIQMIRPCSNPSICSLSEPNVLKLCNIDLEVKYLLRIPKSEYNVLEIDQGHVLQSSTTEGKEPSLAINGNYEEV